VSKLCKYDFGKKADIDKRTEYKNAVNDFREG
jgi:hypothetical protein